MNLELQKSECPTGRLFKSCCSAHLDDRWRHNAVTVDWEVHYCSGFAPCAPTREVSYRKRRKQWATIRIRWLCTRTVLETVEKPSNVTVERTQHSCHETVL